MKEIDNKNKYFFFFFFCRKQNDIPDIGLGGFCVLLKLLFPMLNRFDTIRLHQPYVSSILFFDP